MNHNVKVLRQVTGSCLDPCGVIRFPHAIPNVFNPLSVIPDIFYRESMAFPM